MDISVPFLTVVGISAVTAVLHTLTGPDHYLPFIALARARHWTLRRTLFLTFISGIGHILSAMFLALIFMFFSEHFSATFQTLIESVRGSLAAWLLAALGTAYALWGVRHLIRSRPHSHWHQHADGTEHSHSHVNIAEHSHLHEAGRNPLLAWSLFIIFVLGPCEAMLPILVSATAVGSFCLFVSALIFSFVTLLTMFVTVYAGYFGSKAFVFSKFERWSHLTAGLVLAFCGYSMIFLGL